VWREGMAAWQPYGKVSGGAGVLQTCYRCGRGFAEDEMIRFGERSVCAECKPVFVQALKEGAVPTIAFAYGGFWIRLAAWLIDVIILSVARLVLWLPIMGRMLAPQEGLSLAFVGLQMLLNLIDFAIRIGYETFFVGKYGATPGKMACGLKIVMPDGSRVSYARALARFFAKIVSYLTIFIGFIMAAFDEEKRGLHDRICDTRVVKA
jgi:uncharacterized RDD family membrane protein YckC